MKKPHSLNLGGRKKNLIMPKIFVKSFLFNMEPKHTHSPPLRPRAALGLKDCCADRHRAAMPQLKP